MPFLGVIFYHFSIRFVGISIKKWLLPLAYAVSLILLILSGMGLVITGMQVKPYGYAPTGGLLLLFMILFGYAFVVAALVNLIKFSRSAPYAEERNRSAYVITGLVFSMAGGVFDLLPLLGLDLYPGGIIGTIIFCLFTTLAIVKYHLLDIHLLIRKGVAYFLMSATVAIPYVGIILLFNQLFKETLPLWAHVVLLVLLALVLQPLWSRMQRLVDRWFYRERYDFLRALEDFSLATHRISDLEQLGSSLVQLTSRALQASSVHLLLLSSSGHFNVASSTGKITFQFSLGSRSPLVRWLQSNKRILHRQDLHIIPQLQSLTAREIDGLKKIQTELLVPIVTREEELVGVLILGEKLSEQPYSTEDERLVLTVANRIVIELENAYLYSLETTMRKELQRQDEQKTEFLHSVAHELKTPLTAIISSSGLLSTESSLATSDQRQRLVQNINRSAWLMNKRVSELLDLARMQLDELKLNSESLEIGTVIEEVISQLSSVFKNKDQSLKLKIPNSLPAVEADREKIEQVLLNLLSNANKFSRTGGNIMLRARQVDGKIVVEVKDSAPVIAKEEKDKLFDPYYRGRDADERQRIPGLGLGLAISKKLIELHQGRIWIESGPRKGNTFAFSLPVLDRRTNGIG